MKDLITSIGSITILMIFILQFASNQALVSKFAFSDVIVENMQMALLQKTAKRRRESSKEISLLFWDAATQRCA